MSRRSGTGAGPGGIPGAPGLAPRARTLAIALRTNAIGLVAAIAFATYRLATFGRDLVAWYAIGVAAYFALALALNVAAKRKLARAD